MERVLGSMRKERRDQAPGRRRWSLTEGYNRIRGPGAAASSGTETNTSRPTSFGWAVVKDGPISPHRTSVPLGGSRSSSSDGADGHNFKLADIDRKGGAPWSIQRKNPPAVSS